MSESAVGHFPITRAVAKVLWALLRIFFWLPWWAKLIVMIAVWMTWAMA